jgi:hypothetical protein
LTHKQVRAAVHDTLATSRRLDAAIQQSVMANLAARDAVHRQQMDNHPTTIRERKRRAAARRISRKRRLRRDIERLARRWRARLIVTR